MVFPGNVSHSLRKEGMRYIFNSLQQTCVLENILIFFSPYYEEVFSCLCGERDLLVPVHNVSAYTQG